MLLEDCPRAQAWMKQFNIVDREMARQMLRALVLVSHSRFSREVDRLLTDLISELGGENVALVSVHEQVSARKPFDDQPVKPKRVAGSSADRIDHLIENLVRVHGPRVSANPTVHSMRAQRIRNVVLIDDYIGSGRRMVDFWRYSVDRSVKSWVSYGWCAVWVVCYGATLGGIRRVENRIRKLPDGRVRTVVPPANAAEGLTPAMRKFINAYAGFLRRSKIPLGIGRAGTTLIFEHGCPNNAPPLLWDSGKMPNGERLQALFPDRGVPQELSVAFDSASGIRDAERLWDHGQYKLALSLLDNLRDNRASGEFWRAAAALGFASRTRWDDLQIATILGLPTNEIEQLRIKCYRQGFLDPENDALTTFGRNLLDHLRTRADPQRRMPVRKRAELGKVYYPSSFRGVTKC